MGEILGSVPSSIVELRKIANGWLDLAEVRAEVALGRRSRGFEGDGHPRAVPLALADVTRCRFGAGGTAC